MKISQYHYWAPNLQHCFSSKPHSSNRSHNSNSQCPFQMVSKSCQLFHLRAMWKLLFLEFNHCRLCLWLFILFPFCFDAVGKRSMNTCSTLIRKSTHLLNNRNGFKIWSLSKKLDYHNESQEFKNRFISRIKIRNRIFKPPPKYYSFTVLVFGFST